MTHSTISAHLRETPTPTAPIRSITIRANPVVLVLIGAGMTLAAVLAWAIA